MILSMKHHDEIEIKLRVTSLQAMKRRLKAAGFTQSSPRMHERNVLYDFPDRSLAKADCALRLRSAGARHWLTFKGNPSRSRKYKIREEIETTVGDARQVNGILHALRLHPVFAYEKHRTTFTANSARTRGKPPSVALDETAAGDYVELEGPRKWIDRLSSRLGYREADYVTASYVSLLSSTAQHARSNSKVLVRTDPPVLAAIPVDAHEKESSRPPSA